MHLLSNRDTNEGEESVVVSEVSSFQRLKCMQEWYILGVGKGVLFREVSSVQSTHITTWPRGVGRNLTFIPCNGSLRRNSRSDIGGI